jgi:hypothetical protein
MGAVQKISLFCSLKTKEMVMPGIMSEGSTIPTSTVSCQPVGYPPTGLDGLRAVRTSFCPCGP